ncbi:MAG: PilZ domain-containing protein, partial [Sphingomonas sp.]
RREGQRHISVFRVGRLVVDGQDQLCVVRNISAGGMKIECNSPPATHLRVRVDLRSDRCLEATVRWSRAREAGLAFDAPIDVAEILREERLSIRRQQPRAPRFVRSGHVRIMAAQRIIDGELSNISINGIAVRTEEKLARDEPVIAVIDGLGATHAFARWSNGSEAGFRLNSPLSYRALAEWLDAKRA